MVFQRLIRRADRTSKKAASRRQRRLLVESLTRRELLASDLGAIAGVAFIDEAGDGSSAGDPPVLVDAGGDLVTPGTPGAQGIQIQLFEDTNGDTVFDVNDLLIGTDITDLNGNYRFDGLTAGRYFIEQQAVPQLNTPSAIPVDVTVVNGIQTALIDDYSLTSQTVTADAGTPTNSDTASASEAIGGARDIQVTNTNSIGQVTVFVDSSADTLSIGSLGTAEGTALIQYDGNDGVPTLSASGLGGVSLAGGTPGSTLDPGAGLIVETRADQAGETLFITVYTDASNASTVSVTVPQNAASTEETFVLFSSFTTSLGSGADFNDVGAIEASLSLSSDTDVVISIAESRRPDIVTADIANILPITLGGQLFIDTDTGGGQNDGIRQGTEAGVTGIPLDLYQLTNAGDAVDPDNQVPLTSTTTGAGGVYSFPGLDPGHYAVVVPNTAFQSGATLFGFANSTGNDPASDPDDDVDDDDNGTTLVSGDVVTGTITLVSNSEPTSDGDDANTNSTLDFGFFPEVDLVTTLSLNVAGSDVIAGGNVVFDVVVQNDGPLDATSVLLEYDIPIGLTFTGLANESGSFTTNQNGTTLEVSMGTIAEGTSGNFQILLDIANNLTADVNNTAVASSTEVDQNPADNSESELLDLVESDLSITKTDVTDPVNAGDNLTYTITVTNDGPDAATGVTVTDPLPANVTFVSGDVDGNANLVTFDSLSGDITAVIGPLANQATSTVTIIVAVDSDAPSPLSNTATVSANPNTDPDATNNSSSVDTTVQRTVDLEIDKSVTGSPVAGEDITYTVVVTNNGPSDARGVTVTDTLVSELSLVTGSFDPGTSGAVLTENGQDLSFDIGDLVAGANATFSFDVSIAPSATGTVANTATVSTTDTDSDSTNDVDTENVAVLREVDLIITQSVSPTTAVPGQDQVVYTFTVSHGPNSSSDAADVVVTNALPAGLTGAVISAPGSDDTDFTNGTVTVDYNSLPIGEQRVFTVTVDVDEDATGTISNPVSVASTGTELEPSDNTDDGTGDQITLTPQFDISLTKLADNLTPGPTDTITYTIDVTNSGPSTATGVVLSDTVPTGLTFVSGTLNGQSATQSGSDVSFPAITIDSGATETATLVFTIDITADGSVINTASVPDLTAAGETDATNNSVDEEITVTPQANLSVTTQVAPTEAQPGQTITYTITVDNDGPSTATNITVTNTLPAGLTFLNGTGRNGEALSATNGVVTYDAGDLANDGTFDIVINATVDAGTSGAQVNNVSVSSDVNDPDSNGDASSTTVTIDPRTSSFGGRVFVDLDGDEIQDAGEEAIAGVQIALTGTDSQGNNVSLNTTTDANGDYLFENLAGGTYEVTQTQPNGFRNGSEVVGTGATATAADNVFSQIALAAETSATDFNFVELNAFLSKRQFLASFD